MPSNRPPSSVGDMIEPVMINGRFDTCVEPSDRGFQYGDGVFTTMPVRSARAVLLRRHLLRLARDCGRLRIDCPDLEILAGEARRICRDCSQGILRIQITRGPGRRGYRIPESPRPTRVLSVHSSPVDQSGRSENGIVVRICRQRLGWNTALAGVKHMNRLEQILARAEWSDDVHAEGLMLDQDDNVVEGTMSNVFLVRGGRLLTPRLDRCGVEGIMRGLVLELAEQAGIPTEQGSIAVGDLAVADELFVTNSVIGLWPVVQIDQVRLPVGKLSRRLAALVQHVMAGEAGS